MDHSEYIRVNSSETAVLMIHGIAGTPAHFRELIPVIPEDWAVYNILLDGHGKNVEDFGRSSMQKWKDQVNTVLKRLFARHARVIIVAHSMGTLFGIRAAVEHPEKIPALFLLAAPMRPWVRFSTIQTCLRVARGNIRPDDRAALAMRDDSSIQLDSRLWKYMTWTPRLLELLAEIHQVRKLLPLLRVPTLAFQSVTDELVSDRSCKDLEQNTYIHVTRLHNSGHFAYGKEDMLLMQTQLRQLCASLCRSHVN